VCGTVRESESQSPDSHDAPHHAERAVSLRGCCARGVGGLADLNSKFKLKHRILFAGGAFCARASFDAGARLTSGDSGWRWSRQRLRRLRAALATRMSIACVGGGRRRRTLLHRARRSARGWAGSAAQQRRLAPSKRQAMAAARSAQAMAAARPALRLEEAAAAQPAPRPPPLPLPLESPRLPALSRLLALWP